MSQITPNLDSIVTQDRHVLPSPLIRTCHQLELGEESWEGSLMQENVAGECRTEVQHPHGCPLGTDGVAVLAPTGILVCFKYLTFHYHLGLLLLTKHYLRVTSCLK